MEQGINSLLGGTETSNTTTTQPQQTDVQHSGLWNNAQAMNLADETPMASHDMPPIEPTTPMHNEFSDNGNNKTLAMIFIGLGVVILIAVAVYYYYSLNMKTPAPADNNAQPVALEKPIQTATPQPQTDPSTGTETQANPLDNDKVIQEFDKSINEIETSDNAQEPTQVKGSKDVDFDTVDLELQQVKGF